MKRTLAALLLLTPHLLLAQPAVDELETRLAAAEGAERVALLSQLGQRHLAREDADGALAAFRQSLRLAREIGEKQAIADNLLAIGKIHLAAGRLPAAAETLRRARVAAEEIDDRDTLWRVDSARAETFDAMGRGREAAQARERAETQRSALEAEENAGRLAELEAELEAARQRAELESAEQRRTVLEQRQQIDAFGSRVRLFRGLALAGAGALLLLVPALLVGRHRTRRRTAGLIAERDRELVQTGDRLDWATSELERTSAELAEMTRERDETRRKLERTAVELETATAELETATFELNRTRSELERTSEKLERTSARLEETSALRDQASVQLADTSAQLKQAEDALQRTFTRLEQTAEELAQLKGTYRQDIAELGDRNAAARERLDEMERFTSTIAQHLKILLIAVRSSLGALAQDAEAGDVEQLRRDVERTREAVGDTVRLLDKLLRLLLVGRIVHAPEEVSMSELAFEAVGQVEGLAANRRVEIVIAPDMPAVVGDRAQLLEALKSLLENGGKFMGEQPSPRLEVGARPAGSEPADDGAVFYVRDNGIGIDPADHDRVFTPFERLDPEAEGVGIGLTLVRRIVAAHGGRVWVESEGQGRGSTICFTVPPPAGGGLPWR